MSADAILDRIEQLGLLEDNVIAALRRQVAESEVTISPETVVRMLVDKNLLTSFQGKKLLSDIAAETAVMSEEELELALEEDEEFTVDQPPRVPNKPRAPAGEHPPKSNKQKWKTVERPAKKPVPPPADLEVIEDVGDELVPLDDGQGLAPLGADDPLSAAAAMEADPLGMGQPAAAQRPQRTPKAKKNPWESALMFVGGGGLIVLVLVGLLLYVTLSSAPAEEVFQQAEESYKNEQYLEAIERYQQFIESYPDDENVSRARVRQGLARMWHVVRGASDWTQSLSTAKQELPGIEGESAFPQARDELAGILPQIAEGFATQAREAKDITQTAAYLEQADEAMKLVENPVYISSQLRKTPGMESRIERIMNEISAVRRDVSREKDLADTVKQIEEAAEAGETATAYQLRDTLLKTYPGLDTNAQLQEAVRAISKKQGELVQVGRGGLEPSTDEAYAAPDFQVVLAGNSGETAAGAEGAVAVVRAEGALYGLDAATGKVKWRRFLGYDPAPNPVRIPGEDEDVDDVLAVDPRGHQLLRLSGASGKLLWRVEIGQPLSPPVVTDEAVLVTDATGKLYALDPATGVCTRWAQLPQTVSTAPAVDERASMCYLAADHTNVYAFALPSLDCRGVFYLGHPPGSVAVAPLAVRGHLLIAENVPPQNSRLHVLTTGPDGATFQRLRSDLPIRGRVLTPAVPHAGRVLVLSDLGAIHVLDVDPTNKKSPVSQVAVHPATASQSRVEYAAAYEGQLFVGDLRLTKYEIQTSRGQLIRRWPRFEGDAFVGPVQVFDDVVVHVRRRAGALGLTVAASKTSDGADVWQTSLAAPLAGEAYADTDRRQLIALSSAGQLFEIDPAGISAGFLGRPSVDLGAKLKDALSLAYRFDLGGGRLAFASHPPDTRIAFYDPSANPRMKLYTPPLPAGSLTCPPVLFQDGLLMPSSDGRIYLVDPATGKELAKPLQPPLAAEEKVAWDRPALSADGRQFVVADNRRQVYRVELRDAPEPHLAEAKIAKLKDDFVTPLAAAGTAVLGAKRGRANDRLCSMTSELAADAETELKGRIVWGPYSAGNLVLAATDRGQLQAFDAQAESRWSVALGDNRLVGRPLVEGDAVLVAAASGVVRKIRLESGEETGVLDLGEPLGAAPVPFVGKLLLTGSDGTLFVTSMVDEPSS